MEEAMGQDMGQRHTMVQQDVNIGSGMREPQDVCDLGAFITDPGNAGARRRVSVLPGSTHMKRGGRVTNDVYAVSVTCRRTQES